MAKNQVDGVADDPIPGDMIGFEQETKGWEGYVAWEKYPEKKKRAAELLSQHNFPSVSAFSMLWPVVSPNRQISPQNTSSSRYPRPTRSSKACAGSSTTKLWEVL